MREVQEKLKKFKKFKPHRCTGRSQALALDCKPPSAAPLWAAIASSRRTHAWQPHPSLCGRSSSCWKRSLSSASWSAGVFPSSNSAASHWSQTRRSWKSRAPLGLCQSEIEERSSKIKLLKYHCLVHSFKNKFFFTFITLVKHTCKRSNQESYVSIIYEFGW